jgi:hypothetical protein
MTMAPGAAPGAAPGGARRAAYAWLAALAGNPGGDVWEQAAELVSADPAQLPDAGLDAFVGAAANAVDSAAEHDDPVAAGIDRLLLAVGLCLRDRLDGGGWGPGDPEADGGDRLAGALSLLAAAERIPPAHPAAAAVVETLGAFLDERRPLSGPVGRLADFVAVYSDAVASDAVASDAVVPDAVAPGRAVVAALGALCRTVVALRSGNAGDPVAFTRGVEAVPAEHPWRRVLSIAAGHARLAEAVRSGDPGAIRDAAAATDAPLLAAMLVALVDDDPAALRTAVDRIAATPELETPRVAAVVGASWLLLAERAGPRAGSDPDRADDTHLTGAITSLCTATRTLDDDQDAGLCTRSWWRLSAAYRRRGATGDAGRSRDAGLRALRGADQDTGPAARFAGWMLSEGRAEEAFTALEVAAAARRAVAAASPVAAAGPLVGDVLAALLGVVPQAAPASVTPTRAEVAAAVRSTGATALMYLHPTAESGRTVGVLCLDPATERLDVVANVPVTDPLESDDPSWPAIVERWTHRGGTGMEPPRVLVAATGGLTEVALPAVRTSSGRHLAVELAISQVGCGGEVVRLAARQVRPVGAQPVFVVNPRGDREPEMIDIMVLRRLFYPRSVWLGRASEHVDGAGTLHEVLTRLPGASLVHVACGLRTTAAVTLELAGAEVLDVATLRAPEDGAAGGLVVLPPVARGGFETIAGAFLEAGFSGVIGWLRPVDPPVAALAQFMLHMRLVDDGLTPGSAVGAVQRWMIDPGRTVPPSLPAGHARTIETTDLTQPGLWAPLTYRGC